MSTTLNLRADTAHELIRLLDVARQYSAAGLSTPTIIITATKEMTQRWDYLTTKRATMDV